jgi:hypothetical protein
MPAFLAGVLHPRDAFRGLGLVGGAAFAANGEDAGVALFHHERLLRHRFAHQAVGLFAHRFFVHAGAPMKRPARVLSMKWHAVAENCNDCPEHLRRPRESGDP